MLMRPNIKRPKQPSILSCHCPGDMVVCMRNILARPWTDTRVSLALIVRHNVNEFFQAEGWREVNYGSH